MGSNIAGTNNGTKKQDDNNNADERYLLFFSHSGISNQFLGLEGAAYLAFATNRTLVLLPPVLPHVTADTDDLKYPNFTSKAAGGGCGPYAGYHRFISSYVHEYVKLAASSSVLTVSVIQGII